MALMMSKWKKGVGKRLVIVTALGAMLPVGYGQAATLDQERRQFKEAKKAIEKQGLDADFSTLTEGLEHYALYPYLQYQWLERRVKGKLNRNLETQLTEFVETTPASLLANRLYGRYQKRLFATKQWRKFLETKAHPLSFSLPCSTLEAQQKVGKLKRFTPEISKLWVKKRNGPAACKRAFIYLEKRDSPNVASIWERIYYLMDKGLLTQAKEMRRYLNKRDRALLDTWIKGYKQPEVSVKSARLKADTAINRQIIGHLVQRWARKDLVAARDYWYKLRDRYQYTDKKRTEVTGKVSMRAAYKHQPVAFEWLDQIPASKKDDYLLGWTARTALRNQDWDGVLRSIKAMPTKEQQDDRWQYWRARALEKVGTQAEAQKIYHVLADKTSYHGFLAADRLGKAYQIRHDKLAASKQVKDQLYSLGGFRRAKEYFHVGMKIEARREWNTLVKKLDKEALKGAAVMASRWGWYDRAIYAVSKTPHRSDLSLRFPMPYRQQVNHYADQNNLDPEWIYGVIRRESAFIADVRSHAGAVGLMQLMPATARQVGKRRGKKIKTWQLVKADLNIELGSAYLSQVFGRFGHQALATAAYNAGPSRVKRWLPESGDQLPADIWVETIPFTETRRYVKAVMAYTTIFEWRLKQDYTPLQQRMQAVDGSA